MKQKEQKLDLKLWKFIDKLKNYQKIIKDMLDNQKRNKLLLIQ